MAGVLTLLTILITISTITQSRLLDAPLYELARDAIIQAEENIRTGGRIALSEKEKQVDKIFLEMKKAEVDKGFNDPTIYAPSMHFFHAKKLIEQSEVFKFIRKLPKGAVLHGHNTAMVSSDWVIKNATYKPGIMKCVTSTGFVKFTFKKKDKVDCASYTSVNEERSNALSNEDYDKELQKLINLYTPTPEVDYPHITSVWTKFQNIFDIEKGILTYLPVFREYHWQLLEEMYEDGVMYIELRTSFKGIYDDEKEYTLLESVEMLKKIVADFKAHHPGFFGVKTIYSTNRKTDPASIEKRIETFKELYSKHPDFIIGFDLVGQEDLGNPLHDFVNELQALPPGAQFFFHAGETNWYGASTDYNLLDAILLNTTRIGHGYALVKHPLLWEAVKNRGIAIEISPISNQVLHLVWDMRNHPGAFFVSENLPIVISNDDPGYWDAKGLSYDFYYAFMAFSPNDAGLAIMKNLVWNSIKYSVLTPSERKQAAILLQTHWNNFIDEMLELCKEKIAKLN